MPNIRVTKKVRRYYLRPKLMSGSRLQRRRHQNSVARPPLIHLIERGIIFSNHQNFILMLLPRDANQPVVQKRQISLAYRTNDQRAVLRDVSSRIGERVASPLGIRAPGVERNEGIGGLYVRKKHAEDYQQREEEEEQCGAAAEKTGGGFLVILAGSRG